MRPERPFLTARWSELVMLNFKVPADAVARVAPAGTKPDLFEGEAYLSVVGFLFRDARMFGLRFPGHARFEEVNLRYYVRREVGGQIRRGVVFVQEIAPRPIVAAVARWVYNESYVTLPMRSEVCSAGEILGAGDRVGYEWRTGGRVACHWNRLAARAAAGPQLPTAGSLEEFIVEHYWAYVRGRDGSTWEYRVAHRPWRVAPAADVVWDCDLPATYNTPLAKYLAVPPVMGMIADGSSVQVFRGRRCDVSAKRRILHAEREDYTEEAACRPLPPAGLCPSHSPRDRSSAR
ncbi:MAG TPA: DUF2071 domain-containing protein [Lacipirellulaceae bacterium]|jgi:hypothetical protein